MIITVLGIVHLNCEITYNISKTNVYDWEKLQNISTKYWFNRFGI